MRRPWVAWSFFFLTAHAGTPTPPKRSVQISEAQDIVDAVDLGSDNGVIHFISVATNGKPEHRCFKFADNADLQEVTAASARMKFWDGTPAGVVHPLCDAAADQTYDTLSLVGLSATEYTPKSGDNANVPMVALSFHYTCRRMGVGQAGVILYDGKVADGCAGFVFNKVHDFRTVPSLSSFTLSGDPVPLRVRVLRFTSSGGDTDSTLHFVLYQGEGLVVYRDDHIAGTFREIASEVSAMSQSATDFTAIRLSGGGDGVVCYFQGPSGFSRRYYKPAGFTPAGMFDEASLVSSTIATRDTNAYWPEFDASGKWTQIHWIKNIQTATDLMDLRSSTVPLGLIEKRAVVAPSNDGIWAATSAQLRYLPHCDPADLSYEVYTDQGKFRYSYEIAADEVDSPVEVVAVVPAPQYPYIHVTVLLKEPAEQEVHLVVVVTDQTDCAATCDAWGMLQGSSPCNGIALRPLSCTTSVCALSTRLCCGLPCPEPLALKCTDTYNATPKPGATSSTYCGSNACDIFAYCCTQHCGPYECSGTEILRNDPEAIICSQGCSAAHCCESSSVTACGDYGCPFGYTARAIPDTCAGICGTTDCCEKTCQGTVCPSGYVSKYPSGTYPNDCCAPTCTFHQCSEGYASKSPTTVCPRKLGLCGDDVCCDAILCLTFTCPPLSDPLPGAVNIDCSGSPCKVDDCCTTCKLHSCEAGHLQKTTAGTIPCVGAA
eukprot:Rhum_TRINITY_DN8248_c0_g1::Rhum_TRINITY_DN8248_c0_g1_i1::g.26917::m.26917